MNIKKEFRQAKQSVEQVIETNNERLNNIKMKMSQGNKLIQPYRDQFKELFEIKIQEAIAKLEGFNAILTYLCTEGDMLPEPEEVKQKSIKFIQTKIEENRESRQQINYLIRDMGNFLIKHRKYELSISALDSHVEEFEYSIRLLKKYQDDPIFPQDIKLKMVDLEESLNGALLKVDTVIPERMEDDYQSGVLIKINHDTPAEIAEKYIEEVQKILSSHKDDIVKVRDFSNQQEKYALQASHQKLKDADRIIQTVPSQIEEAAMKIIAQNHAQEEPSGISSLSALDMVKDAAIMVEALGGYYSEFSREEVAEELQKMLTLLEAEI